MAHSILSRTVERTQNGLCSSVTNHNPIRVIAVTSGKGGVGKSNIVLNLALTFDRLGKRVLIMDTNLGLSNIDILSGLYPEFTLYHLFEGEKNIEDILLEGPGNISILPAHADPMNLFELSTEQKLFLLGLFDNWRPEFDIFLIDTAPGISRDVLYFNTAASEKVVVVTPEPTSIKDAATLIKILYQEYAEKHFKIIVNKAEDDDEGWNVFVSLSRLLDESIGILSLDYLGSVSFDPKVSEAVKKQRPFVLAYPEAPASCNFMKLGKKLLESHYSPTNGGIRFFWKEFLNV